MRARPFAALGILLPALAHHPALLPELAPRPLAAQLTMIRRTPDCRACRVVLRRKIVLGSDVGIGEITGLPATVALDAAGRYWVTTATSGPLVFDKDGRFAGQVGRSGQGPGEFLASSALFVVPGDSMMVVDPLNLRGTLVGADLQAGRQIRLPAPVGPVLVLRWPDSVVVNSLVGTRSQIGLPLHHATFEGPEVQFRASFGPGDGSARPAFPGATSQLLAPASSGYWSADLLRYRISRWGPGGLELAMESTPDWYPQSSRYSMGNPMTPPSPHARGIWEDGSGKVWLFASAVAPSWRAGWQNVSPGAREVPGRAILVERMFRTAVDVIDPATGRLHTSTMLDAWVIAVFRNGDVALYEVDKEGYPRIAIATALLER